MIHCGPPVSRIDMKPTFHATEMRIFSGTPRDVNRPPGRNWGGDKVRISSEVWGLMDATSNVGRLVG